jgi:uncharacterized membrane protein
LRQRKKEKFPAALIRLKGILRKLGKKHSPQSRPIKWRNLSPYRVRKEPNMLWTIGVILIVLWLLGLFSGYTLGGVIHVLLVIALIVVVVQVVQSRRRV